MFAVLGFYKAALCRRECVGLKFDPLKLTTQPIAAVPLFYGMQ
jgi:hypothetical protein